MQAEGNLSLRGVATERGSRVDLGSLEGVPASRDPPLGGRPQVGDAFHVKRGRVGVRALRWFGAGGVAIEVHLTTGGAPSKGSSTRADEGGISAPSRSFCVGGPGRLAVVAPSVR